MHLTILSRSTGIYTTKRLVEAARAARHRVRVMNPVHCEMYLDGREAKLFYKRKRIPEIDACIPRIAQSVQNYGLAVVNQLAWRGVPILNSATSIAQSRNKIRCLQLLSAHGIAVPPTIVANNAADLKEMVSLVGGVPVLVKLLQGGERSGVMVCETLQSMEAALEALFGMGHNVVIQSYVRESKGRDVRALVVGGQVVAAVRRKARVGRLALTLGVGAKYQAARLPPEYERIAINTASLVGLEVAAVDMIDMKEGPKVFEVNSSPGIKEIEEVTGVDVARAIIARAAELAAIHRGRPRAEPVELAVATEVERPAKPVPVRRSRNAAHKKRPGKPVKKAAPTASNRKEAPKS